jgi:hypothetical protein
MVWSPRYRAQPSPYGSPTSLTRSAHPFDAAWCLAPLEQVPLQHCERCGGRERHLGSDHERHWPKLEHMLVVPQQSALVMQPLEFSGTQQVPFTQAPLQH